MEARERARKKSEKFCQPCETRVNLGHYPDLPPIMVFVNPAVSGVPIVWYSTAAAVLINCG